MPLSSGAYASHVVVDSHFVLFTTSPGKEADAKRLGADAVVISKDTDAMAAVAESFDFILDTVAATASPAGATGRRPCTP